MKNRGTIAFAAFVAIAGLAYIFARFGGAPVKVVIVNGSGRQVASVTVISGDQRIDLGSIGNGESRKVDVVPGKPLQVDYTFDERRTWVSPEPLVALQAMTVFIGPDQRLRAQKPVAR